MKLAPEQESVLNGESGRALALAMKTLVTYGQAFGAERLVPIESAHLAGSFGVSVYKAYYKIIDQLVNEGAKVKVPTTINPRPGNDLNLVNRAVFFAQKRFESQMKALGVTPNYSCVCYEEANVPEFGHRLAWAESSAVQFANSALGARTNRNSVLVDLCSAVTGLTPEFGYLLDENRRGKIRVKLKIDRMDASALGYAIGQKAVDRVPVIEHYEFSRVELKNMGGAMAAAGGVALFHVEGLTPEAPDMKAVFEGEPEETITVAQEDLDALRTRRPERAGMVVFGCPQMTYDETLAIAERIAGKKLKIPTWLCVVPEAKKRFEETELCWRVRAAGAEVFGHCPVAALTLRLRGKRVLTSSGKCFYYLDGADYGTVDDCLSAAKAL